MPCTADDRLADAMEAALEREAIALEDGEQTPAEAERLGLRSVAKVLQRPAWESTADLPPAGVAILDLMKHQRGCPVCARRPGACPTGADIVERWNRARGGGA